MLIAKINRLLRECSDDVLFYATPGLSMGMSRWLLKLDDGLAWVKGILFRSGGKRARRNSSR